MRWQGSRKSGNVEDYRGARFGGAGLGMARRHADRLVAAYFFGIDPRVILGSRRSRLHRHPIRPARRRRARKTSRASSLPPSWAKPRTLGARSSVPRARSIGAPKVALFSGQVRSACGFATAASGPFYCPSDGKVYLDLAFYDELKTQIPGSRRFCAGLRFGSRGRPSRADAARHRGEGASARSKGASEREANQLQVGMELQADCYAGVWAHNADATRHILEQGDVDEALQAASAVGDDTIQKRTQGRVVPDSFTHGTAEQRSSWFKRGLTQARWRRATRLAAASRQYRKRRGAEVGRRATRQTHLSLPDTDALVLRQIERVARLHVECGVPGVHVAHDAVHAELRRAVRIAHDLRLRSRCVADRASATPAPRRGRSAGRPSVRRAPALACPSARW